MNLRARVRFVGPFAKGAHTISKSRHSILPLVSTAGIVAAVLLAGAVSTAFAAASLTPLGSLRPGCSFCSEANGVSADGSVVVGDADYLINREAFRWTSAGGMVGLGDLPGGDFYSNANAVSADGSVIVGNSSSASGLEAFRWTSGGGMVGLGYLPGWVESSAYGASADGSVIVGNTSFSSSSLNGQAFRWTSAGGMVGLGDLPGGQFYSGASGVSADGSVIVGN